jgi:hypothetical protein
MEIANGKGYDVARYPGLFVNGRSYIIIVINLRTYVPFYIFILDSSFYQDSRFDIFLLVVIFRHSTNSTPFIPLN